MLWAQMKLGRDGSRDGFFLCEFSKGEQSFTVDRRVWGASRDFVLRGELLRCVLYGSKNAVFIFPHFFLVRLCRSLSILLVF